MKYPRTLAYCLALTLVLGASASALGQDCAPGQILTPCSSAMAQARTPGDINAPQAVHKASTLTEIAANVLQSMWSLF
jgi:hypothetical protein